METTTLYATRLSVLLRSIAKDAGANIDPAEISDAYAAFADSLKHLREERPSLSDVLRELNFMKIELQALQKGEHYEAKKKCARV